MGEKKVDGWVRKNLNHCASKNLCKRRKGRMNKKQATKNKKKKGGKKVLL